MKLTKLTVKNFMPYKGEQSILFPQDSSRNVLIVYGDNMRGKTSLLNAIRWGLYGKAFSRHKALIGSEKILNSEAAKEGDGEFSVEIKFEAGKHQYDLIRIAKMRLHVSRAESSSDFEEHVFLKRDGVALAAHQIEPEINLFAPEQVSRFFLFDGELLQEYEMLLEEGSATGEAIKEAIEQVLGVPALINGRDECLTLLKNAERQQNKDILKIVDMGKLADQQKFLQEKDDVKARDLETCKEQLKRIRSDKNILDDEIEALSQLSVTAMDLKETHLRRPWRWWPCLAVLPCLANRRHSVLHPIDPVQLISWFHKHARCPNEASVPQVFCESNQPVRPETDSILRFQCQ
jgi:DNA sulfur modification protein DndD